MSEMFDQNIPIDILTVWQYMVKKEMKMHVDNIPYYLTRITRDVVSSANLEYHCYVIKEMWRIRELERITQNGIDPFKDTKDQIREINNRVSEIQGNDFKKDWLSMEELMFDLFQHQREISEGKKKFITTGFKLIDKLNGGFYEGQMIVIGARPSMGKSALVGKIAVDIARTKKPVGIISLEMDNSQIAARLASVETEISFQTIYRNLFDDEKQHERFHRIIANESAKLPIYVSDKTKVDVNEIKAKAMKLKSLQGCDCLIVDYLQLVDGTHSNKNYNREQEVAKISRGLKLLAIELQIPVIVVCQLNREGVKRSAKDRYPRESDLRESGAIEQDADSIILLHRDWKAGYENHPETGETTEFDADLFGVKWRNGSPFHLPLKFDPPTMKFTERKAIETWKPIINYNESQKEENLF